MQGLVTTSVFEVLYKCVSIIFLSVSWLNMPRQLCVGPGKGIGKVFVLELSWNAFFSEAAWKGLN